MSRLEIEDLLPEPVAQFARWYEEAAACSSIEFPNAMCLSTIGTDGYPQGRMVLLKNYSVDGFVFYTNLESAKGQALAALPKAALTFYWDPLQRQVRIQGDTAPLPAELSDRYFNSRDFDSRLGAWASAQSRPLSSRRELEERVEEVRRRYAGRSIPRPPHWGGIRLVPRCIEFWQGGEFRLHDRFLYSRKEDSWEITRLNP